MRLLTVVALVAAVAACGCKKKAPASAAPVAQQQPNPQPPPKSVEPEGPAVAPGPVGRVPVERPAPVAPVPPVAPGRGGGTQDSRGTATRIVTRDDMNYIHVFIDYASGASGKMPTPQVTLAALQKEVPKVAEMVSDGTIVLHNARQRESVWAYEKKALDQGGLVVTNQGVDHMDAATLKQRLRQ